MGWSWIWVGLTSFCLSLSSSSDELCGKHKANVSSGNQHAYEEENVLYPYYETFLCLSSARMIFTHCYNRGSNFEWSSYHRVLAGWGIFSGLSLLSAERQQHQQRTVHPFSVVWIVFTNVTHSPLTVKKTQGNQHHLNTSIDILLTLGKNY